MRTHIVFCTGDANDLAICGADFVVQLQILHAHELAVGDRVRVTSDCYDDSEPRRPIAAGSCGDVKCIDTDSDFQITLDDINFFWIFHKRSSVLRRHTCMETMFHKFCQILDDYVKWKLQAMT